jgi:putative transposase
LIRQIHAGASIWNHCLALQKRYYRMYGKHLGANRLMKHVARLRKENPFWQQLGSQAVQDVIQRLEKSWKRFFSDPKAGRPRFKKSRLYTSFTLKQAGWKYGGDNRIKIGKHNYKFVLSREVTGTIKTVTIKRDRVGDLWICFSVVDDIMLPRPPGEDAVTTPIGIDWGLKNTMNFSDGRAPIDSPFFLRQSMDELRTLQRRLSKRRHRNGGRRTTRTEADRKRVARLQRRIADQRRDWAFKTAHELCEEFDGIAVENLSGVWMQRMWGRKASDVAWSEFLSTLEYVCMKRGVLFKKVDPKNTSRICSECGAINKDLTITDRVWTCECGTEHDRDVNAAINILERAFSSQRGDVSGDGEAIPLRVAVAA